MADETGRDAASGTGGEPAVPRHAAAAPGQPGAPAAANGRPGAPSDAVSAFVEAAGKAAKEAAATPGPDPAVAAAFALGWQMAELYRPAPVAAGSEAFERDLPDVQGLAPDDRAKLSRDQIKAALAKLADNVGKAGLEAPDLKPLDELDPRASGEARREKVAEFHVQLLSLLAAVDFRLGKAYALGTALAEVSRNPGDRDDLEEQFHAARVRTFEHWLDDLSSALPPHAGHSVAESLERWRHWVTTLPPGRLPRGTLRRLRRQGELWRALLSGEKAGPDTLEIGNYLAAAACTLKRMESVLGRLLRRFWYVALLVVVLFGGAVALMLAENDKAALVAGAGAILASLGVTWKGLGSALGTLGGRLERPLWGAEIDRAVADAITLLPHNAQDFRGRGDRALQAPPVAAADDELAVASEAGR